jgi:adenine-specific DNA-methyltransferase
MFIVIKTKRANQKYLTALLNSNLIAFWLHHRGKRQGNQFQIDTEPLLAIPLCVPSEAEQEKIAKLVQRIITYKQQMHNIKTDAEKVQFQRVIGQIESKIQDAIETIYGLNEEDRKMLEVHIPPVQ